MSRSTRRRRLAWAGGVGLALLATLRFGNDLLIAVESAEPSVSHGTPANGSLEHGKRLPSRGDNFRTYSDLGALLGRNALHGDVRTVVLEAYAALAEQRPESVFVYGETGWPSGGRFRPHRTHQNGMAVDFFVPVVDGSGTPRTLPTHALLRFGYDVEFSADGQWRDLRIDYPAMAAHLRALAAAAAGSGLRIEVVIFDDVLQRALFAQADELSSEIRFSRTRPWVRHDEHYHVVFARAR